MLCGCAVSSVVYRYTSYTECCVAVQDQAWCIGIPVIQNVVWLCRIKRGVQVYQLYRMLCGCAGSSVVYRYTSYTECCVAVQDQAWCIGIPVIQNVVWLCRIKRGV